MEIEDLKFAALLHDIGKFYQRTKRKHDSEYDNLDQSDFGQNGAHAKWSADFIGKYWNSNIADLALHHHAYSKAKNRDLSSMVMIADHHSSGERIKNEDNQKNQVLEKLLVSVFSEISIEDNESISEKYVPLHELKLIKCSEDKNNDIKKFIKCLRENNGHIDYFDDLKPLDTEKMSDGNLKKEYNDLWKKFTSEISQLSYYYDFNTVLALLKKYTSTIPSAAYVDKPDISLYDHSKTTAALALCRYLYYADSDDKPLKTKEDNDIYLVVNGDISGIQNFIFKVSSPQDAQSGMSKRLRGRSLYLTLINEAITSYIIEELDLCEANIIFCGGGRFTVICPNTKKAILKLEEIKDKVNKWFIRDFNAELYLALVYHNCNGEGLADFGNITQILSNKLSEDKKHKFVNNLDEVFNFDEKIKYGNLCSVCGKPSEETICGDCRHHEKLGQRAANADYLIKIYVDYNNFKNIDFKDFTFFKDLNIGFVFKKNSKELTSYIDKLAKDVDKLEIIKINNTDFIDLESEFDDDLRGKMSFTFKFLGNRIPNIGRYSNPNHRYMPLYFEHLAKLSRGSNKLGVLKMDVDNLGKIFSGGFSNDNSNTKASISRISTLSSQLDMFFSGFINNIAYEFNKNSKVYTNVERYESRFDDVELEIQNDDSDETETATLYKLKYGEELSDDEIIDLYKYRVSTIYIDYSGGDDLLVIGPYDDIILFAQELQGKFKTWTCNNPSVNLSAGINIVSPKFPIGKAVLIADDYLEAAKSCGRDKITLFGEVLNWETKDNIKGFNELLETANCLEKNCENKKLSKGFVYSMLHIWQSTYENKRKKSLNKNIGLITNSNDWDNENALRLGTKRFVPIFKYKLRLVKDKDLQEYLNKNGIKFMPWVKIPVSWVSLRMR